MQLELFHGDHLPLLRARAALEAGDLRRVHEELASAGASSGMERTAHRLAALERLVLGSGEPSGLPPERVHAVFDEAFASGADPAPDHRRDALGAHEWFRLYAAHMAAALAPTPAQRFRGWWALHFELAAERPAAALVAAERLISSAPPAGTDPTATARSGTAWLEAARAAHAAGEAGCSLRWTLAACLVARAALDTAPPPLERTVRSELHPPDPPLPRLPRAVEDLWLEAQELGLAEPACAWVPCLGILGGTFPLADLRSPAVAQAAGFDLDDADPREESAPRAFLRSCVAAREARLRETQAGQRAVRGCGPLELRARAAMKRASPELFERYLKTLGLGWA